MDNLWVSFNYYHTQLQDEGEQLAEYMFASSSNIFLIHNTTINEFNIGEESGYFLNSFTRVSKLVLEKLVMSRAGSIVTTSTYFNSIDPFSATELSENHSHFERRFYLRPFNDSEYLMYNLDDLIFSKPPQQINDMLGMIDNKDLIEDIAYDRQHNILYLRNKDIIFGKTKTDTLEIDCNKNLIEVRQDIDTNLHHFTKSHTSITNGLPIPTIISASLVHDMTSFEISDGTIARINIQPPLHIHYGSIDRCI